MKNITFSANEETIQVARKVVAKQHRTLNELFREWLAGLEREEAMEDTADRLEGLWEATSYLKVGHKLSREEMNEG